MSTPYQKLSVPSIEDCDAIGSPAIASNCHMCGEGFSDRDLQELEWPLLDSPAHRACYLEHSEAYDRWNRETMRGA